MSGIVPPQIETPRTFIGVGARELAILGVSGLLGLLALFLPLHPALRIAAAVFLAGSGLALAFGRDRRSGKTLEGWLLDLLRFYGRKRFHQKGAMEAHPARQAASQAPVPEAATPGKPAIPWPREAIRPTRLRVRPLSLGPGLLLSVMSCAFLAGLLAWIWLGGWLEIQPWLGGSGF